MRSNVALVALVACAAPSVAYRAEPAFSADEQAEIWRAAESWNAFTKHEKRIARGTAWRILKKEPPLSAADDDDDPRTPDAEWNGECSRKWRTIWIHPHAIKATTYQIAIHEFGHALGLGHTTTGVMMATTVSTDFTPEVMAECRRVGSCR